MIPITKVNISEDEKKAVMDVLDSGMVAQGAKVKELEEKWADYCGSKHSVAVNSGTAALHCALNAIGVSEGDEVITVPFTFVATVNPIIMCGAKPVFVDIGDDYNIDASKISDLVTDKTKAIIVVDLYGQVADYDAIRAVAPGVKIIEDACQAHGATLDGKKAGTFGDIGCFSLYATKNIQCGEGGLIVTDSKEYANSCRRFRHHGQSDQYEYVELGYNYRMTDIQAAIGIFQLGRIEEIIRKRIANAGRYILEFGDFVVVPEVKGRHVFHQFTIRTEKRDELKAYLIENGIGCGVYYPKPLHLHSAFLKLGYKEGDFPVSEKMSREVLSIPVHPLLSDEEVDKIVQKVCKFFD